MPEPERDRLFDIIKQQAVCYGIGIADERTIDEVNILQATIIAMEQAVAALSPPPDYLLLDAITLPRVRLPQKSLIKGRLPQLQHRGRLDPCQGDPGPADAGTAREIPAVQFSET